MIILTFILSFICITSYVNAEDGLSCTFLYDTTNENSDKSSITLPINFYGDNYLGNFKMIVKGKSINRYSNDGNLDVSNYPYVERMALDITLHTLMALMQLKVLERMMMVMLNGIAH